MPWQTNLRLRHRWIGLIGPISPIGPILMLNTHPLPVRTPPTRLRRPVLCAPRTATLLVLLSLTSVVTVTADDPVSSPSASSNRAPLFSTLVPLATNLPPAAGSARTVAAASGSPASSTAPGTRNADVTTLDDKRKLGVGDRVIFRVLEDQETPKALVITDAGELDVPELGLVTAAGKTCQELAFEIKSKLEKVTYYHATVILGIDLLNQTLSGRRVYVAGQVQHPGPQEIPAGETWTVTKAIMRAGGLTQYADKKRVRVVRTGPKGAPGRTLILNVARVLEQGNTELDLAAEPEDLIYVPTRAVNF